MAKGLAGGAFLSLLIEQVSDLSVGLGFCKRADLLYQSWRRFALFATGARPGDLDGSGGIGVPADDNLDRGVGF